MSQREYGSVQYKHCQTGRFCPLEKSCPKTEHDSYRTGKAASCAALEAALLWFTGNGSGKSCTSAPDRCSFQCILSSPEPAVSLFRLSLFPELPLFSGTFFPENISDCRFTCRIPVRNRSHGFLPVSVLSSVLLSVAIILTRKLSFVIEPVVEGMRFITPPSLLPVGVLPASADSPG